MKRITAAEFKEHLDNYLVQAQSEEVVVALENGNLVKVGEAGPEAPSDEAIDGDTRFARLIAARRNGIGK